jgi:hypothetical protein
VKLTVNYNLQKTFYKIFVRTMLVAACCFGTRNNAFAQSSFSSDNIYYSITSTTAPLTVEVATYNYNGEIKIPSTVSYNGQIYTVTAIGNTAFVNCMGLTSVTIPNSVRTIGNYAFQNCVNLTEIFVKSSVPPTVIGNNAFFNVQDIPVHVPYGKAVDYRNQTNWGGKFSNIIDDVLSFDITLGNVDPNGTVHVIQRNGATNTAIVAAEANAGYRFKEWRDGGNDSKTNPRTVRENVVLTPTFEPAATINPNNGIVYVKAYSTGNGSSWANAYPNLTDVLEYAKTNNNVRQIWVAEGTYYPLLKASNEAGTSNRDKAFVLVPGIQLYGGFPATNNPMLPDRNWAAHKTVLSGDINFNNALDNSDAYHVIISAGNMTRNGSTACLDGFIITGGKASGNGIISVNGGNIDRVHGGGIHNYNNASPVITNVAVSGNSANEYGGGMYNYNNSSPVMTNVIINDNKAESGGGIYNDNSYPYMLNATISGNNANNGGGIYNSSSVTTFVNSIIWGNRNNNVYNVYHRDYSYSLVGGNGNSGTNIDVDPKFENGYQLHILSPAVNKGTDADYLNKRNIDSFIGEKDLSGGQRKTGQYIDMGAYENQIIPKIKIAQPSDTVITEGSSGRLSVEATRVEPEELFTHLKYQWYRDDDTIATTGGVLIPGATGASYTIPSTLKKGVYYYYVTISTVNADTISRVATVKVKVPQPISPAAPVPKSITDTSVTFNNDVINIEYRNGETGEWQDSPVFNNLKPNSPYTFYARYKETDTTYASPASKGTTVMTLKGTLTVSDLQFALDSVVYNRQEHTIKVSTRDGIVGAGVITVKYNEKTTPPVLPGTYEITVDIDEGDNYYAIHGLYLGNFVIGKRPQAAPSTPVLDDKTATRVSLKTISGAQYRNGETGEWQDSPIFSGLQPNTEYVFYARYKEDSIHNASFESHGLTVVTDDAPEYGIALTPSGNHTFGTVEYGYVAQTPYRVTVSNIGYNPTGTINISLNGTGINNFLLSHNSLNSLAVEESASFTIVPNTGLAPGVYLATVIISSANSISASFDVSFTVNEVTQTAPPAPTLVDQTETRVILNVIPGAEYRNGNGEWQDIPIFDGLIPNTSYIFYARMKGSDSRKASPSSEGLLLFTDVEPNYGIALSPSSNHTFASDTCGYLDQPVYNVMVSNVGNQPTGKLLITLSGDNSNRFILSATSISNIEPDSYTEFTVVPKTGLETGTYSATVTLSGRNNMSASFDVNFTVNKARRSVPAAPTLFDKTATSVTLTVVAGAQYRNGITGEWQDSPVFNGLIPNTGYAFYMRMKGSNTHEASDASDALSVVTNEAPTYGISLLPSGNYTFPAVKYGYKMQDAYKVVISNIGNNATGILSISLTGEGNDGFTLSHTTIDNISAKNYQSFNVIPNTGLVPGIYSATVTVSGANDISVSFDISLTVYKASQNTPAAPTLNKRTATSVTLNIIAGAEYRNGDGEWQDNPVFNGLAPNTAYIFYARMKETLAHEASPASDVLPVSTDSKPNYGISLNPAGNHDFASDTCGYLEQPKYSVMVTNVGNRPTGDLLITLSDDNSNRYDLSLKERIIKSLDPDGNEIFDVFPLTGLGAGTYIATVIVSGANDIFASFELSFSVEQAQQAAPSAPTLKDKTSTSIILDSIPGAQYRNGVNGEWQDSYIFNDLTPYTSYTFYARMKETATHKASPPSGSLSVTTDDTRAELLWISIDDIPFEIADTIEYWAKCKKDLVKIDIGKPRTVKMIATMNGKSLEDFDDDILLNKDLNTITIQLTSEDGQEHETYILIIYRMLDAHEVLYQRWGDVVIAAKINTENNGNRAIERVRWYSPNDDKYQTVVSEEFFIKANGDRYRAEFLIDNKWYRECGDPEVRAIEKVIAYPNPVSMGDNLNLHLPTHFTGGYLNVISLSGSTVKHKLPLPNKDNIINVSDWSPGIYLLNIVGPDGNRETIKIIVNN